MVYQPKPKFVKLEGKTIVSPKCSACADNEHEYCNKVQGSASHSCGCTCWHKS